MSRRSQLIVRLSVLVTVGVIPVGCSDPYQHGAGVSTSAMSSPASATATVADGSASTPSAASSTTTTTSGLGEFAGPAPSSADVRAAAKTARAFIGPYVLFTYGQARATEIPAADPALIAQLAANPPSVPPSVRSRHPKVTSLSVSGGGARHVAFQANVSDRTVTYGVPLTVTLEQKRWLVTSVQ